MEPSQVCVHRPDFLAALSGMTPAAHRSATTHARWGFSPGYNALLSMLHLGGKAHEMQLVVSFA